ncbi:MAG: hypothetical protein ACTSRG_20720 [Candidatus Helarchaeota archaeon]
MNRVEKNGFIKVISEISKQIVEEQITTTWWFKKIAREYLVGNMQSWIERIQKYGIKHFFQFIKWLINPFTIRCYLGLVKRVIEKK